MNFTERPPSTTWETIVLGDAPGCHVWIWFKPPQAPHGLSLRVPDALFSQHPQPQRVTLRYLLHMAGINAASVAMWSLLGASYHGMQGMNPVLDYPLPPPGPGVDPTIVVALNVAPISPQPPPARPPASQPAENTIHGSIESDWHSSLLLEKQLTSARKKMSATLMRINSLNRDLNADEWRNADNRERTEWQEARRWLRDVATRLSRYIKDYDIGITSAAGKRTSFEATYEQCITRQQPVDGIEQLQRDFEAYRKTLQTLMNNMQSAQAAAERDGEQRAQRILGRIAASVRAARAKRS
jgi:hypothetical protein